MDVAAFLLALVPIIWLVVMLLCFKWPAWKAAIGSFVLSCLLAFAWWHLPAAQIATASLEGFLMALWPIVLVIIAAVFTYNLCVRTGAMDVIGSMITSISSDRRLLGLHRHPHGVRCRPGGFGFPSPSDRSAGAARTVLCGDAAIYCAGCGPCCR